MCSTVPFKLIWSRGYICNSFYYHHQIGRINLSHCFNIFPWLCVWSGCTVIFSQFLYIYIYVYLYPGKSGLLFPLLLHSLPCVQILEYIKAWMSYLLFVHLIIIIVQTYLKALNIQHDCPVYSWYCSIPFMWVIYSFSSESLGVLKASEVPLKAMGKIDRNQITSNHTKIRTICIFLRTYSIRIVSQ